MSAMTPPTDHNDDYEDERWAEEDPNEEDCPECLGTGIGRAGPDSPCSRCAGMGYR